jgi:hypothetical protein
MVPAQSLAIEEVRLSSQSSGQMLPTSARSPFRVDGLLASDESVDSTYLAIASANQPNQVTIKAESQFPDQKRTASDRNATKPQALDSVSKQSTADSIGLLSRDHITGFEIPPVEHASVRLSQLPSAPSEDEAADPELGILQLREVPVPGLDAGDPELGNLRLREATVPSVRSRPSVYLQGRAGIFWSDNIFSSAVDPTQDGLFQSGVSLYALPSIAQRTYLTALVSGRIFRYFDETDISYNELQLGLGVYRVLNRRTYLDARWLNQQLFRRDEDDRFLNDHQLRFAVGRRDRLARDLDLNTSYRFRLSLADPEERSRVINTLAVGLTYEIRPRLEADLSYQFVLIDFTQQNRNDSYHQLIAQLSYDISRDVSISIFGGGRLGNSSESRIDLNTGLFGINIGVSLPLF